MKYKDLTMSRVSLFLAFFLLPAIFLANPFPKKTVAGSCETAPVLMPPPIPSFTYQSPLCGNYGDVVPTTSNYSGSGTFFSSPPGLQIGLNSGVITTSLSTPGTYTVSLLDPACNNGNGCIVTTTIQIKPVPIITISGNSVVCLGNSVSLNASGGTNYNWSTGQTGNLINPSPVVTTVYQVNSVGSNGCVGTKSHTVTVKPLPSGLSAPSKTYCAGGTATLEATVQGANPTFTWYPGAQTGSAVVVTPPQNFVQIYTVVATVNGCTASTLYVPVSQPTPHNQHQFFLYLPFVYQQRQPTAHSTARFYKGRYLLYRQ